MKKIVLLFLIIIFSLIIFIVDEPNEIVLDNFKNKTMMQIKVNNIIIFELNNSQASKDLYEQLPLVIDVEDYGSNEKIFYPLEKLDTNDTPLANAKVGTLAYYAPWGDVVMFYGDFGSASGLYELGNIVSGGEYIKDISGKISIDIVE
jgi:hypothetical protein